MPGALDSAMISSIGRAPRQTRMITTTVNTRLSRRGPAAMAGSLGRPGAGPAPRRTVTRVSEEKPDTPSEDDMKTARELHTESHDPAVPEAYAAFMRTGWGDRELDLPRQPVADLAAARRDKLAGMFPGERLVLPAGTFKVRSNDTDYKFRPDTAHTYFSGNQTSDAVLVVEDGESVLYARPRSARDTDEFFRDRQYGELWVGRRPSLHELSGSLGIECRHIDRLQELLTATNGATKTRVLRGVAADV